VVINHLGWQVKSLEFPPRPELSPDVLALIEDGSRVGVEVTELCDQDFIKRQQKRKKGEKASSSPFDWTASSIQEKLRACLVEKGCKRYRTLLNGDDLWCEPLAEYFVVVHTDEPLICSQPDLADVALAELAPVALPQVTRAFFLIWYVPKSVGPRPRIYEIAIADKKTGSAWALTGQRVSS
jgi:hypothetical protein